MDHTMTKNPDSIPYNIWPAEALRLAEREAADSLGLTLFELMQRAGEAAFQLASCAYPASAHWLILCGHGNNGGDGYVVARLAQAAGRRVTLLAASSASPEATAAWKARLKADFPGMKLLSDQLSLGGACHIGEGGLGVGLSVSPE